MVAISSTGHSAWMRLEILSHIWLDPTFCFSALGHGFTKPRQRAVRFEMFDWHVIRSMHN
jgi:hypothetical protein